MKNDVECNAPDLKILENLNLWKFLDFSNFANFWKIEVLYWFWAIFDLKFGLPAKNYVECSAPDLKGRLGVDFPEGTFFFFFRKHR